MNNIRKIKFNKKIVAILLLLITLITEVSPVLAVSGSGSYTAGQFASGMITTESYNRGDGILIRKLIDLGDTSKQYTVFCAEHGEDFVTESVHSGSYYAPNNEKIKTACKIAYFGWYEKYGDYLVNSDMPPEKKKAYAYTQQYMWEKMGDSTATFVDSDYQSGYVEYKKEIQNKIDKMKKRPSFDAETITLDVGETKTLTDTNGVLEDYSSIDETKNNIRIQHTKGQNTLKITVADNCKVEKMNISDSLAEEWGLVKEASKNHDTSIYFYFATAQDQLLAMNYNDPVPLSLSLKINLYGKLELKKIDENGELLDGAIFHVTGPDEYSEDVNVKNGKIVLENLKPRNI